MSIFSTGTSGLFAAQAGIDVTGHNISNVNTEGYSRQRVGLATENPYITNPGPYGRGVKVTEVVRVVDEVISKALNNETTELRYWEQMQMTLSSVEVYFNELEQGSGLGDALKEYFNAWSDLSNTAPDKSDEADIKRYALVEKAGTLSGRIRESYEALEQLRDDSDTRIEKYVTEINDIAKSIASLNADIAKVEATGNSANDFRDKRDSLINRLSEIANITVHERRGGQVAVFVGGEAVVDEAVANQLQTIATAENNNHLQVIWKTEQTRRSDIDITSNINGGLLYGELRSRDTVVTGYQNDLDKLARTLIAETNRLHATGQGLVRTSQQTSTNGVINPTYALDTEAGKLPYDIQKGTFRINVYNAEGKIAHSYDIAVDPEKDTVNNIIQKICEADGNLAAGPVQAYLSQGNSMRITAQSGYTFAFEADTSGFLVAAGFGGFFAGSGASTIDVSGNLKDNPDYIATGVSGAAGDNSNARAIADLKFASVFSNNSVTIDEFYGYFAGKIGSDKYQVDVYVETKQLSVTQLQARQDEVRGVSMDEEMTNLMKFQRAYEASARFITTVDEMLNRIVNSLGLFGR